MALFTDDFNRADTAAGSGLGTVPDGPVWEVVTGTWRILSNRAYTSTAGSSNPIAVAEFGGADADASVSVGGGGDAVYLRVIDANNWLRARVRQWTTTSTKTEYEWADNYNASAPGGLTTSSTSHSHINRVEIWGSSPTQQPSGFPSSYNHTHEVWDGSAWFNINHNHGTGAVGPQYTGQTRQVSGSTTTWRQVIIEKAVAGTITTLATSPQQTASIATLRLRAQGNALTVFINGSTSSLLTVNESAHNDATKHGLGRGTSNVYSHLLDNFSIDTLNTPPLAPTQTAPASGATVDLDATVRLAWQFNDPDPGDSQSKFEVEYRPVGTTTATTVAATTTSRHLDRPGGTFAAGDHEWRVRTADSQGSWSPWSGWSQFTAAASPDAPTFTNLSSGQIIGEETYAVQWSTPAQESFQVRTTSTDGLTVYTDSGTVVSGSTRQFTVGFDTNGRDELVELRVQNGGLWSTWTSVPVSVSYTAPAVPTTTADVHQVELAGRLVDAGFSVAATHPAPEGSEPTVIAVDVFRRRTDQTGDGIRVAADLGPTEAFIDYGVAFGLDVEYRHRAYGDNGTSSLSDWTETPAVPEVPDPVPGDGTVTDLVSETV